MHPKPALPPHLLRLADAGDAKPAWITLLTTEHYNLGMQRAATISEVNGRASIFIGAVSAGLIALGFEGAGSRHSAGSTVFAALVLTPLLFLGLVTFGRCLQIAIDDWEFSVRIMRLRAAYAQLVPELAGLLAEADTDEAEVSMFAGRWQALQKMLSVAGSMAVISSVVLGADAGAVAYGLSASLFAALLAGTAAGTVLMFATGRYQWGRWCVASSAPARTSALSVACRPLRQARPDPIRITAKEHDVHKPETYDAGFSHQIGRYSDAIRVPAGQGHDQIIVSGTPGLDENGAIPADFADEARQAWQNIGAILAKAGASVSDIVSGRQYLTRQDDIKAYVEVSKEMITHEPALMLSVVSALVWPSIHVELEVVALVPSKGEPAN